MSRRVAPYSENVPNGAVLERGVDVGGSHCVLLRPNGRLLVWVGQRRAFNGLCLAILQSVGEPGQIRLTARAEGFEEASIEIEVEPGIMPAALP